MPRTFKDALATDVANACNANEFAEEVLVIPPDDDPFTISAIVDRTEGFSEQQEGLYKTQTIEVFVSRDATTGIAAPRLGYGLVLDGGETDTAFSYDSIIEGDEQSWTLRFVRSAPRVVGGNRQSR
jgi:hypothetical protein